MPNCIGRTPSPVLTAILLWTCGSYFEWDGKELVLDHRHMPNLASDANGAFLDTRLSLQLVCHEWNGLITYCGSFWSSYTIGPGKSRTEFYKWTRRMTSVPSHIVIAMPSIQTRMSVPSRVPTSGSDGCVSIQDVVGLLRRQAAICATLFIAAPNTPWLAALDEGIRNISFPAVSRLALVVCDIRNERLSSLRSRALLDQPTLGGFSGTRCKPYMLRLKGVGISWTNTTRMEYSNISTLVLHFLGSDAAPLVHELHSMLEHASALERMSIHDVHLTGSYMPKTHIIMNRLRVLEYGPGGCDTLGLLMANIRAPGMLELHLSLGKGDMQIALRCAGLFNTAIDMRITCADATKAEVRALYTMTPAVYTLDIVFASLRFLNELHDEDLLPGLRALVRHETWFELLYNLANRRRDLSRLVLYRPEEFRGIPIEMNPDEMADLLGLIDSVDVHRNEPNVFKLYKEASIVEIYCKTSQSDPAQFTLGCSVHDLPFVPVHMLARPIPWQTLIEILTFTKFDFAPGKEPLVVEDTLFVGDYVGDKVAGDDVVGADPVTGIRIGAEPSDGAWFEERRSNDILQSSVPTLDKCWWSRLESGVLKRP
ncbi:hypothetical protein B0H14DRAFT_2644934 [Mycena olivaceomarginata]|nr:hypothetical protein B0H14DRAFT_2644934 [Mycena olivaceomarginata]